MGAPQTTPTRKHQPAAAPARGPRPAAVYPITPPEPMARPSAAKTIASRPDSPMRPSQARIEAGPAWAAARPGSRSSPGPSSAPM